MIHIEDYQYEVINYIMACIGYWFIFGKCGVKKFYALIPVLREYQIGVCADMEKEGRTFSVLSAILYVINAAGTLLQDNMQFILILTIPFVGISIAYLVYEVRISLGLIKVFDRKKVWIWLFLFLNGFTAMIWGLSKKFQPVKMVENLAEIESARTLGVDVQTMKEGLTVNLNKRTALDFFKKKILIKDIHMCIPKGHMVLLLGGSGAGKTTLVNAVTGYEKADAKIQLGGEDVYTEYAKMMYDIGFVPQQDLMRGNDTVMLTLADAAAMRLPASVSLHERKQRIDKVLDQFGLAAVKNSLVEKLSGGQRKRLSIAMEYISDPTLFILDEPDSGLDGVVARGLFEKLREIADQDKIVVVITHTPDRVIDLFDDVIVLAKDAKRTGRLAWYGPVKECYEFFGKDSMEDILLSINQVEEGGEGRADEFVAKYAEHMEAKVG